MMKKIVAINDLSGLGRCSLTANLPIISALGVQCCPLPTGILSNQTGYPTYQHIDFTPHMEGFAEQWDRMDVHYDGIITGYISSSQQGKIITGFIKKFATKDTIIVVDPVMGDNGELCPGYDDSRINAVKEIVNLATVITPNLTELCILAGEDYKLTQAMNDSEKIDAIHHMSQNTKKTVVTTGIHMQNGNIANAIYNPAADDITIVESEKYGGSFSGTGDILTSIITAQMVKDADIVSAVKLASQFISQSILSTLESKDDDYIPADGIFFENNLGLLTREANI